MTCDHVLEAAVIRLASAHSRLVVEGGRVNTKTEAQHYGNAGVIFFGQVSSIPIADHTGWVQFLCTIFGVPWCEWEGLELTLSTKQWKYSNANLFLGSCAEVMHLDAAPRKCPNFWIDVLSDIDCSTHNFGFNSMPAFLGAFSRQAFFWIRFCFSDLLPKH